MLITVDFITSNSKVFKWYRFAIKENWFNDPIHKKQIHNNMCGTEYWVCFLPIKKKNNDHDLQVFATQQNSAFANISVL